MAVLARSFTYQTGREQLSYPMVGREGGEVVVAHTLWPMIGEGYGGSGTRSVKNFSCLCLTFPLSLSLDTGDGTKQFRFAGSDLHTSWIELAD